MKKRSRLLSFILFKIAKILLMIRYKVKVEYLTSIENKNSILFLPNHPAEIDPILLMVYLGPKFFPRPMVVEHFYRLKGFQWILDLIGVTPIPTMEEKANIWRGKEVAKIFKDVVDKIKEGDNFVIYPAGKLKPTGKELIGGASFVHSLLQTCPEINVVLVRTTGLWGSSFSRALTGKSPEFAKTLFSHFFRVLKNGIFFLPKRHVLIEIAQAPSDLPVSSSRLNFNKYLEDWYNRYPEPGSEPLSLVSYSAFKDEFIPMNNALQYSNPLEKEVHIKISEDKERKIVNEIASLAKVDVSVINRKTNLSTDLGLDSLDIANLHIYLDRQFDVTEFAPGDLLTVEDILLAVSGAMKKNVDKDTKSEKKFNWPKEPLRKRVHAPKGKTIPEAFLNCCDIMGSSTAAADAIVGPISYKKMKIAALALSSKIQTLPGDRIGVMTPSSVGAYITILACYFAKKIPVMLNWTAGVRGLDHANDLSKISYVLTSRLFLDRAGLSSLGKIESKIIYLEDVRHSIKFFDKIDAIIKSYKKSPKLIKELGLDLVAASDPAVVLFTSGTESLPKAVPLSHENILFNQSSCLSCVKLKRSDCMYGVLPPFHSFGFSVTGLMPLLSGLKAFYAPDPNNSRGIADDIRNYRLTVICSAPSFIRALFAVASPEDLKSLKLIVSGAEKATQIQDYIAINLPNAKFLEGYGITECSPVVTLTRFGQKQVGVGSPIPGVKLCIVNPITKERQDDALEGEICIHSASVFSGYLSQHSSNPFIMIDGEKWYMSGDMGYLDNEHNLILTGRLKRFVKIGGEMLSLGGLEEEIVQFAVNKGLLSASRSIKSLALSVKEKEAEKPELILFTTVPISREEINGFLKDAGWGRIIKITEVHHLDEIPLTGVGKTDYRLLDEKYLSG